MSSTRISAAELVDWTDQALLYLKVGGDASTRSRPVMGSQQEGAGSVSGPSASGTNTSQRPASDGGQGSAGAGASPRPWDVSGHVPDVRRNLCHLRCYGIRTATDLMQAHRRALQRAGADQDAQRAELAAFALPSGPQHDSVPSIQVVIDTLPDEEWFVQVHNWRKSEFGTAGAWYRYLDGRDWQLQVMAADQRHSDSANAGSGDDASAMTSARPASTLPSSLPALVSG